MKPRSVIGTSHKQERHISTGYMYIIRKSHKLLNCPFGISLYHKVHVSHMHACMLQLGIVHALDYEKLLIPMKLYLRIYTITMKQNRNLLLMQACQQQKCPSLSASAVCMSVHFLHDLGVSGVMLNTKMAGAPSNVNCSCTWQKM